MHTVESAMMRHMHVDVDRRVGQAIHSVAWLLMRS